MYVGYYYIYILVFGEKILNEEIIYNFGKKIFGVFVKKLIGSVLFLSGKL